ncbi:MAG: hypothetical protein PHV28_16160, partial [Kiritimatiellae bacterium]|nr:hypothetical protein [Kiritimatiellia bacterium]
PQSAYAPPTIVIAAANIINFFMSTPLLFLFFVVARRLLNIAGNSKNAVTLAHTVCAVNP